jgi:hypothetical protein
MSDRTRSWKTDSQWIRLALTATGLGVSLILASVTAWKSSPVIYVGATLAFVGAYISCAVLVLPLPLPLLLSERRNRAFRRRAGAFLVEGQGAHNDLRLKLSWQLNVLRELEREP